MFEEVVANGETLAARLENNLELANKGSARHQPSNIVSFAEIHSWYSEAVEQVTRTLGPDLSLPSGPSKLEAALRLCAANQ